jgi:hypothetical protein
MKFRLTHQLERPRNLDYYYYIYATTATTITTTTTTTATKKVLGLSLCKVAGAWR